MTTIYVEITDTKGSAPRDAGTVMAVTADGTRGTIGGGALEYQAIATAQQLLQADGDEMTRTVPLGPGLGQCCGGAVTLRFGRKARAAEPAQTTPELPSAPRKAGPLWIWGAGHVGRAVVQQAMRAQAFDITWIDTGPERFPACVPSEITQVPASDMPRLAQHAPKDAHHLILTYSHDIDLALCAALLERGFGFCGLIGSDTKWARFRKRLRAMGRDPGPVTCPIGDKSLGKHPDLIAYGTIKSLLAAAHMEAPA